MEHDGGIFGLIDLIYAAALNPERWDAFLYGFTKATNCESAGIHFEEPGLPLASVGATVDFDPAYVRQYEEYDATRNVWIRTGEPAKSGEFRFSNEHYPEQDLVKSEYYNDWLRPQNLFYGMGMTIGRRGGTPAHVSAFRSKQSGPYGQAEADLARILIPHLERAFELHGRVAELEMHKAASNEALDRLPVGVLFVAAAGEVVFFNRAAKVILDQNDGLRLLRSKLVTATKVETERVSKSIVEAGNVFYDTDFKLSPGGSISISRPSGRRPFSLTAVPFPQDACRIRQLLAPRGPTVTVLLKDPESEEGARGDGLIHGFGLTPSEARIAYLLMQGKSIEDCAGEVRISIHTTRTYVKRVFSKTGTKRQGELVRVLMKTYWPFVETSVRD
jgi:DNA-binding CsgD family transcriptional regulator